MQRGCTKVECLCWSTVEEDDDDEEEEDVSREHDDIVRDIVDVFFGTLKELENNVINDKTSIK